MHALFGCLILIAVLAVVVFLAGTGIALLHRPEHRHGAGTVGNALQQIEGLFIESKRHVVEEQRKDKREEKGFSGDPPE